MRNLRSLAKRVATLGQVVDQIEAERRASPASNLSNSEQRFVKQYASMTPAVQQYEDVLNGTGALSALFPGPHLPASMSVQDLAELYQSEIEKFATARKFKGIRT